MSNKTLVIVLAETRAHELTFTNFKKNVIDTLNADLCICIGVDDKYDYSNPFYQLAKYKFTYQEPADYGDAFDIAYTNILAKNPDKIGPNHKHWREFLKIKDQFMGGVKDPVNQHPGSAGILIFFRWFLLQQLTSSGIIANYDRFVITRSDFIYQLPHPNVALLASHNIWIPNGEYYDGYTDRHVILSQSNIVQYLNIFDNFVLNSEQYHAKMSKLSANNLLNLEQVIKFHINEQYESEIVREFPYVMYSVRNINGTTRWSSGVYSDKLGYFVKYWSEYSQSSAYKNAFNQSGVDLDIFYENIIKHINHSTTKPVKFTAITAK